jgi:hypothetical protein
MNLGSRVAAGRMGTLILLLAVGLDGGTWLAAGAVRDHRLAQVFSILTIGLAAVSVLTRHKAVIRGSLILALLQLWTYVGFPRTWPFHFLEPLLLWGLTLALVGPLRQRPDWIRLGSVDRLTSALALATVAFSVTALAAWFFALRPDVSDLRNALLAQKGVWLLLSGLVFAVVNAVLEELIWRGILMDALRGAGLSALPVLLIQAASFGVAHIHGFPRGALGVAMAGVYGLVLGILRQRSGGLGVPILTHIAADAAIFALLTSQL